MAMLVITRWYQISTKYLSNLNFGWLNPVINPNCSWNKLRLAVPVRSHPHKVGGRNFQQDVSLVVGAGKVFPLGITLMSPTQGSH